jgi:glucokinase
MSRCLLAADVGGTKIDLLLAVPAGDRLRAVHQRVYASQDHAGLDAVLEQFFREPRAAPYAGAVSAACFSVAGPVEEQRTTLTNLGWQFGAAELGARHGFGRTRLINDFMAAGHGIAELSPGALEVLQAGAPVERGTRVVVGAGTGLGVGLMMWQGERYAVHPSEAGHADFAPVDELQDRLLVYLRRNFGRVSYERVVSGPGLMRIFGFLQDSGRGAPSRQLLAAMKKPRTDPAEVIAEFALAKLDPLAVRALDLFASAYGAFAGNIALGGMARGGVYVAGGIAPKIVAKLKDGGFVRAFTDKGRFSALLSSMPVQVVMDPRVGLYGALLAAARL